ncbi:MAG: OmpA family protein [Bacteroidota bacterium]
MKNIQILFLATLMIFASCVPKKKLISEQNRVKALKGDSTELQRNLDVCYDKYAVLQKQMDTLKRNLNDLSSTSQSQLANSQSQLANSQMTIEDQKKRLTDLQNLIQSQKDVLNKLRKTVADALVNFKPDELTVEIKDGKLYVSLQEKLLFKSGSAAVDPQGKQALQTLATVLNNTPDINVMIEGHTDSVPIRGKFEDNWALSVARATSIVRVLTNEYSVDSKRIIASGRGEFFPVDDNTTSEGRARNRRTEIVLSPNLNELFRLLEQ